MTEGKRKLFGTILGILLFSMVVVAFTYASYVWRSGDTLLTININDSYFYCESGLENDVSGLAPVLDYRDGTYQTFAVNNIGRQDTNFSLSLNIEQISDSLKDESFKYKLMVDNIDCEKIITQMRNETIEFVKEVLIIKSAFDDVKAG